MPALGDSSLATRRSWSAGVGVSPHAQSDRNVRTFKVRIVRAPTFALLAGTALYQGARLIVYVAGAAATGPADFGVWVLLTLIIQYSAVLTLGLPNGAGHQVPFLLGAGRTAEAQRAEDSAFVGTLVGSVAAACTGFLLALGIVDKHVTNPVLIAVLVAAVVFTQQLFVLAQILFRSRFAFHAAAVQLAIAGLMFLAAGLVLLPLGIAGLAAATLLGQAAALAAAKFLLPRRPRLRWHNGQGVPLATIGAPIMLAGVGFAVLTTVDRWLVLAYLGRDEVGIYGLVGIAVSGLLLIASVAGQQYFPRLVYAHGEGRPLASLHADAVRQGLLTASATTAAATATFLVMSLAVPRFLPQYAGAVTPLVIMSVGVVGYASATGFANLLNAVGRQRLYLSVQCGAVIADVLIVTLLLKLGWGLVGVAVGSALTLLTYAIALGLIANVIVRSNDVRGRAA